MATKVYKDGKGIWIPADMLHHHLQNGYTVDNKPPKKEQPQKAKEDK